MKKDYWILFIKFLIMVLNFLLGFLTGQTFTL